MQALGELTVLGLSLARLAINQPSVVVASLTAFGEDGPYADFQVTELVADAIGGPVSTAGLIGTSCPRGD